ncbi:pseudouridine synthase [Dipodascopsis uninucleata]
MKYHLIEQYFSRLRSDIKAASIKRYLSRGFSLRFARRYYYFMASTEEPPLKKIRHDLLDKSYDQALDISGDGKDKGIVEQDVGISQYLGDHSGFRGVLKQRYTDFLVNEIALDGNVLHVQHVPVQAEPKSKEVENTFLDSRFDTEAKSSLALVIGEECIQAIEKVLTGESESCDTPTTINDKDRRSTIHNLTRKAFGGVIETHKTESNNIVFSRGTKTKLKKEISIDETAENKLKEYFGESCITRLREIISTGGSYQTELPIDDKDERGIIHRLIREAYHSSLDSKTLDSNCLEFKRASQSNNPRKRGGKHNNSQSKSNINNVDKIVLDRAGARSQFTRFTIYKENKETMEVCRLIAKFLRKQPKSVGVAGTKDRRGVTVQRAFIHQTPVERLVSLNRAFRDIVLCDFEYSDSRLKLGDLKGNEFYITIRNIKGDGPVEEKANKSLESLKTTGFINYYGMQRFGTHSVSTHSIGIYLLKKDWAGVIKVLLQPQILAIPESKAAREQYARDPGNPQAALDLMPRSCSAEHAVLRGLVRSSTDMLGAIMNIPRNLRLMYVHAYQSYVWNCVVSERIRLFGTGIVPGDLVIDNQEATQAVAQDNEDSEFEEDIIDSRDNQFIRARPITEAEITSGLFTIYDIVMPTPGFDVVYPENKELRSVYEAVMSRDSLDPYDMRRSVKEFSLSGSYRHILSKPESVEWWFRNYNDPVQQMVRTDIDIINSPEHSRVYSQDEITSGDNLGLVLRLKLGSSQYATMALREVMKIETSRRGDMLDVRIVPRPNSAESTNNDI